MARLCGSGLWTGDKGTNAVTGEEDRSKRRFRLAFCGPDMKRVQRLSPGAKSSRGWARPMRGREARSGSGHAAAIFHNCVATAIGGASTYAVTYCWQHYLRGTPPEWALGTMPSLVGGAAVLGLWQVTRIGFRW